MAGGRISPRQKMINMMYLVLTALLALNVSADILNSFEIISDSLEDSASKLASRNDELGVQIKSAVEKLKKDGDFKDYHAKVPAMVDEVQNESKKLLADIEKMIKDLMSEENGAPIDPETGRIENKSEQEKNYRYLMGNEEANDGRGNGAANRLSVGLQKYVAWANAKSEEIAKYGPKDVQTDKFPKFEKLTIDPKDDPKLKKNTESHHYKWEYYTFHNAPVVANIALMQKFKSDVNAIETELLDLVKIKLGKTPEFEPTGFDLFVAPYSQGILAGQNFEGELVMVPKSDKNKFQYGGPGVTSSGSIGKFKIPARVTFGPNEFAKKLSASFNGQVLGGSKPFTGNKTVQYTVFKPTVSIGGPAVTRLYSDCWNNLQLSSSQLEAINQFSPKATLSNGTVEASPKDNKKIRVMPNAPGKSTLIISNNLGGQLVELGRQDFKALPPPAPELYLGNKNGKKFDATKDKLGPDDVFTVVVEADNNFADALPDEAKYKVSSLKVLKRKFPVPGDVGSPFGPSGTASRDNKFVAYKVNLSGVWKAAGGSVNAGVICELGEVSRVNSVGKVIPEKTFTKADLYLSYFVGE
jgi:gliding motility-associated protein GldM